MGRLIEDPGGAQRIIEAGLRTVKKRFSAGLMVEQTLRLYRTLLDADAGASPSDIQPPDGPPRRRLTVLHLNTERGWRGGENQTLQLIHGLRRRGHAAILGCQRGGRLEERAREAGVPCHALRMHGDVDPSAVLQLRRLLRDCAPDVVHYHTSHAVSLGTLAGMCGNSPPAIATKRTSFPLGGNPLSLAKYTWRVARVIAVSQQVRDMLVREGIPPQRVTVVHSGIELERFKNLEPNRGLRTRLGWNDDHFVIGNVAHLARHKGHEVLLDAFARAQRQLPQARLLLVGDGEERPALEAQALALGQTGTIHFAGFQSDVPPWLSVFDLFVLPSLSGEGSPAVVKEAWAAGIPVLSSDVEGIREIIEDERNGRIVPLGDAESMARGIIELALDPGRRASLAERGRSSAERFSMDRMIDDMEQAYRQVVEIDSPDRARSAV
jgi:glycosyltransferase involved in cell wall biosynthesis